MNKPRIFSGIQPSGNLHLGNYLGAIRNWVKLQDEYDSIFCVVDMHAITVPQNPAELRRRTIEVAKVYLASGIDPKKSTLFIQSQISEHAELMWILNTITKNSELARMTQFKDKAGLTTEENLKKEIDYYVAKLKELLSVSNKQIDINTKLKTSAARHVEILEMLIKASTNSKEITIPKNYSDEIDSLNEKNQANKECLENENNKIIKIYSGVIEKYKLRLVEQVKKEKVSIGLFDYPVLMASDIILYDSELVPVGKDQKQHVELTRTLAERFNKKFGETFVIPKAYTTETSENIVGLDDPSKKMSKSAKSEYNYIALSDDEEIVRRKIKKAVTDSGSEIVYDDSKPALKNLINIYSLLSEISPKEIEKKYAGKGYSDFKNDLADVVVNFLTPLQQKIAELTDEKVLKILEDGAKKVRPIAKKKLEEVKKKIGFIA